MGWWTLASCLRGLPSREGGRLLIPLDALLFAPTVQQRLGHNYHITTRSNRTELLRPTKQQTARTVQLTPFLVQQTTPARLRIPGNRRSHRHVRSRGPADLPSKRLMHNPPVELTRHLCQRPAAPSIQGHTRLRHQEHRQPKLPSALPLDSDHQLTCNAAVIRPTQSSRR